MNNPALMSKPFIHVEIVDFASEPMLLREAADFYCTLKPERKDWSEEKRLRLAIRTECRWGRVPVGDEIFMVSEFGEGPREPLSSKVKASVKFYAELRPTEKGGSDGYIEPAPFCQVEFDAASCRKLRSQGLVRLEEFIRRTVPECAKAFEEWQAVLSTAKERYAAVKAARQAKASVSAQKA